ncbi:hypothetical protein EB796_013090 [Bugula neritina]|uniref:Uncharacterized protein n=1 Tax=Bugula neritina TaxID=10212 RepID=A0A7J7JSG0_BUGNE|nr:hypothetical protein EB796_013090 [Bugula neritina]
MKQLPTQYKILFYYGMSLNSSGFVLNLILHLEVVCKSITFNATLPMFLFMSVSIPMFCNCYCNCLRINILY